MGFKFSNLGGALGIGAVASPLTLLGTAGAFADTAANVGLSLYSMNRQEAAAREDYNRQINMWNMTNEYNSPAAQMARYKAAGLNPNLIYGQSNTAAMPNVDSTRLDANFGKITAMSDAIDGIYNVIDRKDAEEAMKQLHKEKLEAKKRQDIIDARNARAFEMQMKIQEAQYRNLMAQPYLKEQEILQKDFEKKSKSLTNYKTILNAADVTGKVYNMARSGVIPSKLGLGKYAINLGPTFGPIAAGLQLGYMFKKYADWVTHPEMIKKADYFYDNVTVPVKNWFKSKF